MGEGFREGDKVVAVGLTGFPTRNFPVWVVTGEVSGIHQQVGIHQ